MSKGINVYDLATDVFVHELKRNEQRIILSLSLYILSPKNVLLQMCVTHRE